MRRQHMTVWMAAILCISTSISMTSCGQSGSKDDAAATTTQKAASPKKAAEKDPTIFYYTSQHRKDNYVPTEEKMGFTKQIGSVNEGEFRGNTSLKEVYIAPQIKHIDKNAFEGCTSLEKCVFQSDIPVINDEAFKGCTSLKELKVDAYTIGLDTYNGCTSLQSARFGEHIYWIREGAFAGCKSLRSIIMAITMQKLEDAFKGCTNIEEFSIPNDHKNRMFGMLAESQPRWKKIYLLSTEFYQMPKNCTPNDKCTLYVPDAFLSQFQGDSEWSKFGAIEPLSKTKYFTAEGFLK